MTIFSEGANTVLNWQEVCGAVSYSIYRSTQHGFTPNAGNLLGTSPTNSYIDPSIVGAPHETVYYVVTANY